MMKLKAVSLLHIFYNFPEMEEGRSIVLLSVVRYTRLSGGVLHKQQLQVVKTPHDYMHAYSRSYVCTCTCSAIRLASLALFLLNLPAFIVIYTSSSFFCDKSWGVEPGNDNKHTYNRASFISGCSVNMLLSSTQLQEDLLQSLSIGMEIGNSKWQKCDCKL